MSSSITAQQAALLQDFAAELTAPANPIPHSAHHVPAPPPPPADAAYARNLEMVLRIPVAVKIVLGSATMPVSTLVKLGRGAVIPLDRKVGEPVDVVVNGRVVARGEVVVLGEDNQRFGISLTEVVGPSGPEKAS